MASFMLRKAPPELWEAFKARAQADGYTLRWIILELIRRYVTSGLTRK